MKKVFLTNVLIITLLLAGCSQARPRTAALARQQASSTKIKKKPRENLFKPDIHKKYKGFKLATVPAAFRRTWYRGDPDHRKISKLVISAHLVNGFVVYHQTDPDLKLNHNSAKDNKEYGGVGAIITSGPNQIKVRGFLDTVDLVYTLGNYKGNPCLYLSYGTNPKEVNGVVFKDRMAAYKYRKQDLSHLKLN